MTQAKSIKAKTPAKTPAKPGEAGFDWAGAYPGKEVFLHTAADGTVLGLPSFAQAVPSMEWFRRRRKQWAEMPKEHAFLEEMFQLLESCAAPETFDAAEGLSHEEYVRWYLAWRGDAELEPGK